MTGREVKAMRKSTRALAGMLLLDLLLLAGTGWMVLQVRTGAWKANVPQDEAIGTITSIGGGAIGIVTAVLITAFFMHRKRGN
jgi:hypothetical protein